MHVAKAGLLSAASRTAACRDTVSEESSMKKRTLGMVLVAGVLGLNACAHAHKEGPLEKAGRKTDEAADDVKEGAENAADDVKKD
jgi:hypothetical protein